MTREELNDKYPCMADTELLQHANGGGWVEHPERVGASAFVAGLVSGNARVFGNARVCGNARVFGNARVCGNARVFGDAQVYGNAQVYGDAQVYGNAQVSGNALVYGNARVYGDAQVYGNAQVSGNAQISATPWMISLCRHTIVKCDGDVISIGCHVNTLAGWLDKYEAVGRMEGYTKEEIARYGAALKMIEQLTAVPVAA